MNENRKENWNQKFKLQFSILNNFSQVNIIKNWIENKFKSNGYCLEEIVE